MLTRLLALAAIVGGGLAIAPAAHAGVVCPPNGETCYVVVDSPGTPGAGTPAGPVVPASTGSQMSPGQWAAYLAQVRAEQKAAMNDASTQVCSGGATYIPQYGTCGAYDTPQDPAAPPAPPTWTPWMAAQSALEQLLLTKPQMGSAPCMTTGCKGLVGAPMWVWTEPWQPQSVTATAGPFSVTAVAQIASVRWDLGDGVSFTCTTSGTAYDLSRGWEPSPDCGNARGYQRPGNYVITATYTWNVTWSGATSGSTTINTSSSTPPTRVTEAQAIVTATS